MVRRNCGFYGSALFAREQFRKVVVVEVSAFRRGAGDSKLQLSVTNCPPFSSPITAPDNLAEIMWQLRPQNTFYRYGIQIPFRSVSLPLVSRIRDEIIYENVPYLSYMCSIANYADDGEKRNALNK